MNTFATLPNDTQRWLAGTVLRHWLNHQKLQHRWGHSSRSVRLREAYAGYTAAEEMLRALMPASPKTGWVSVPIHSHIFEAVEQYPNVLRFHDEKGLGISEYMDAGDAVVDILVAQWAGEAA